MQNIINSEIKQKNLYNLIIFMFSTAAVVVALNEYYKISIIIFLIPISLFIFIKFSDYFQFFFIGSLFFGIYLHWQFRVQVSLLLSLMVIFLFITYKDTNKFNKFLLPKSVKLSAIAIILAVFLSSVASQFTSFFSVYYATIYFIFSFLSYVIFRSVKSSTEIDKIFTFYVVMTFLSSIIILFQIFSTGYLRATGISGFAIIDFTAFALVIILFRNFLLSKIDKKTVIFALIILVVLITTQSRFAWLGFTLSSVYGLIICYVYSANARKVLSRRTPIIVITLLTGIAFFFIMGLDKILIRRVGGINLDLFENTGGEVISNSLESRVLIWITAFNAFMHNPITGVGYLRFSEISENYNVLPEILFNIFVKDLDAHTTYLNFLCETGIIGFVSFLIYIITIFRFSFKSIKLSKDIEELKISIVLNLLVFFIMVHSIYSGAFTMGQNALFMHLIFGLSIANYVILNKKYERYNIST